MSSVSQSDKRLMELTTGLWILKRQKTYGNLNQLKITLKVRIHHKRIIKKKLFCVPQNHAFQSHIELPELFLLYKSNLIYSI